MAEDPDFDHLSYDEINWLGEIKDKIELLKKEVEGIKLDSKLTFIYLTIILNNVNYFI